jgi:hypothetical protein
MHSPDSHLYDTSQVSTFKQGEDPIRPIWNRQNSG